MKRVLVAVVASLILATTLLGCSSSPRTRDEDTRPVRFAVIAAPELRADDGDLLLAVTRLSREKDLAFVLVPGPLLAKDADRTSLELLKNDLGQLAPPVYVAFAAVSSGTVAAASPTDDEILTALEGMGPGAEHRISYQHVPARAPGYVVNVLKWDGTGGLKEIPPGTKRVIQLTASTKLLERADISVALAADANVSVTKDAPSSSIEIRVPALSRGKALAIATLFPLGLDVAIVPLEGPAPPQPEPLRLPPSRDMSPP
jgi:predicted component of type VI protein secretion system